MSHALRRWPGDRGDAEGRCTLGVPRVGGISSWACVASGQNGAKAPRRVMIHRVTPPPRRPGEQRRRHVEAKRLGCLLLDGLLIMGHSRRRIVWLGVYGTSNCRVASQPTHTSLRLGAPLKLPDPATWMPVMAICSFGGFVGIRDRPTSQRSPWQNGYAERLIGSIRRECLDYVVVFGERHLRHLLLSYMDYYNTVRTHPSLAKNTFLLCACACSRTHPASAEASSACPIPHTHKKNPGATNNCDCLED